MANFSNCPFADQDPALRATQYTKGRKLNGKEYRIDTITLHCVVGHLSMKSLAGCFQGTRKASSNYGIMDDGKIGLFVEEKDRSWCSSSSANDVRAITVEIDSDAKAPYAMTDGAVTGAIRLCVDVCKRNGISKMYWYSDKETALMKRDMLKENEGIFTAHRFFANKSCPGDFLFNKMGWVCDQVNAQLAGTEPEPQPQPQPQPQPSSKKSLDELAKEVIDDKWGNGTDRVNKINTAYKEGLIDYNYSQIQNRVNEMLTPKHYWRVQTGAFKVKENADKLAAKLKASGYDTYIVKAGDFYKVQLGAFSKRENADKLAVELMMKGFDTYIIYY